MTGIRPEAALARREGAAGPRGEPALTDALRALRVTGHLLVCEAYAPPWGIAVPRAEELAPLLGAPAGARAIAFHLVRRGHFELHTGGAQPRLVDAGQLVVCTGGQAHRLLEGRPRAALPLVEVLARKRPDAGAPRAAAPTALVCGAFVLRDVEANPLFGALPQAIQVDATGPGAAPVTRGVAELLIAELAAPGSCAAFVVERLLELLCAQAVADHARALAPAAGGWLAGVRDPALGAALSAVHARPGAPWTVARLAKLAARSPSRFAARFREVLGESPMAYVTRWRMYVARRMLRDTALGVAEVSAAVGYDSAPAFGRVFKRAWGAPPSAARTPQDRVKQRQSPLVVGRASA